MCLFHEGASEFEVGLGFAWVADDDIGCDGEFGVEVMEFLDGGEVFIARVVAAHFGEDAVAT